jgi:membrane-bound serine protease (ClpP class)
MLGTIMLIILLLVVALFVAMMEILTPSLGILGTAAAAAAAGAIWLAWQESTAFGIGLLIAVLVVTPLYLVFMVRWLPTTSIGQRLFLKRAAVDAGEGTPEADALEAMVGKTGLAETMLRPSGAVRIDGQRVVALSESGTIDKGQTVTVLRAAGTNLIVRAAEIEENQA